MIYITGDTHSDFTRFTEEQFPIQTEMTNSLNNGEEYTIQDLEDLKLENHEIEVKISDDIAVVTVDGYTFNIDSEFNLSEE